MSLFSDFGGIFVYEMFPIKYMFMEIYNGQNGWIISIYDKQRRQKYENSSSRDRVCGAVQRDPAEQHHSVTAVDISAGRVEQINRRESPLVDQEIEEYLRDKPLDLRATTDGTAAYREAEYIIIATPTNYDSETGHFDTSSVEDIFEKALAVDVTPVTEEYLIFLVALWRPLIESIVAEHDVVLLAVVLNADDLFDDIALRAVHVGRVFDKIRDIVFHDLPPSIGEF